MALALWFATRQAREALRNGQLETARDVLRPFVEDGYRKAISLWRDIALAHVARAERSLRADNVEAAWKDLLAAESLESDLPDIARLRVTLTKLGLAGCRAAFLAGQPMAVLDQLGVLKLRAANHPDFNWAEEAAKQWVLALEEADRGEFPSAFAALERTKLNLPEALAASLESPQQKMQERQGAFLAAFDRLQTALELRNWRDVIQTAEDVLREAPANREARQFKAQAWEALKPPGDTTQTSTSNGAPRSPAPTRHAGHLAPDLPIALPVLGLRRFMLWIDGVGGYLVCLAPRITFGQATANGPVDVPLFADVSRLHAEIVRDGEGYVLESARDIAVNGSATPRALLRSGDRVTLGTTCQFTFAQPVPISPTARLDLVSGHRLPVAVDGILLMAENLILGPGPQSHVVLPDVPSNVILFRSKDGIGLRFAGSFRVGSEPCKDRAALSLPCHVSSETFSFALELLSARG